MKYIRQILTFFGFRSLYVIENYPNGECPDCCEPIPYCSIDGDECANCGHIFR